MKVKIIILFSFLLLLSGCLPTNTIDETLMVEGEGFDYIGHGKVIGTIVMPSFVQNSNPGSQGAGMPTTASLIRQLSGVTYDGKSLVDKFQSEGQEVIRVGSMKVMLFNKQFAKHGLSRQFDFRNRDPDVPSAISIAVVDGSAKKLLSATDYQTQIPIARYIQHMIAQNSQQNYPLTNLRYFLDNYYGPYMDPFMPLIRKNGDHLEIKGLALFKHDKYAMSINENTTFIFKMLYQKFDQGVFDFQSAPGKHVALRNVQTTVKYKVTKGNSASPKVVASVKIMGYVRQAYPKAISTATASRMEKEIAASLAEKAEKLVHRFQKKGIDPLRIGDTVRSFTYHFDGKTWKERYPNADFHCRVHVNIIQTGISH